MDMIRKLGEVNDEIEEVMTQWRVREIGNATVINNHQDLTYDKRMSRGLCRVHNKVEKLLTDLSQYSPHFKYYAELLNITLRGILDECAYKYVDKRLASHHNVWYVAYEDWLRLFTLERVG